MTSQTIGALQGNRRMRAFAAFVVVVAIGIGTAILFRSTGTSVEPATDNSQTLAPQVTLPPVADPGVPVTVLAGGELSYFRYLPDIDLAWRDSPQGSEICWTTPAGSDCTRDFPVPETVVIPTVGQVVVLTTPGPTAIEVELSNGQVVVGEVVIADSIGLGYVRVALPEGVTVVSATVSD